MRKNITILLLALTMCLSCSPPASAQATTSREQENTIFRYEEMYSLKPALTIANGTASCSFKAVGNSGTTSISATAVLYRVNTNGTLTEQKTWSGLSADGDTLIWSASRAVTQGHTYRLTVTATVYRGGRSETVTQSVSAYAA